MSRLFDQPPSPNESDSETIGNEKLISPYVANNSTVNKVNPKHSILAKGRENRSDSSQERDSQNIVFSMLRDIYEESATTVEETADDASSSAGGKGIEAKRAELYEALDHLDEALAGKSLSEATHVFSGLLALESQLCLQKTDGMTLVRTRLRDFFPAFAGQNNNPELRQTVILIFSPEEIDAIRKRLTEMKENDSLKPFFTMILDQSFDVVRFNEMTGWLLLEMCVYFIMKLRENGYGNTHQTRNFQERYERSKKAFDKSVRELRDMENIIQWHVRECPVLVEMPRLLRALMQIRLGFKTVVEPSKIITRISEILTEYNRSRKKVAYDFNRLPSFQHELHLRHSNILRLQKDILEYSANILEQDLYDLQNKLNRLLAEIEANAENLKPGDPEYEEKINAKSAMMKKLEEYRRKVNLVKSQEQMVDVQQQLVQESIKNYNKRMGYDLDAEEGMPRRIKIDKSKYSPTSEPEDDDDEDQSLTMQVRTRK